MVLLRYTAQRFSPSPVMLRSTLLDESGRALLAPFSHRRHPPARHWNEYILCCAGVRGSDRPQSAPVVREQV
jgi:hypothetical protein